MTNTQTDIARLEQNLKYNCTAAARFISLIPRMKGNWLFGANIFRLMSPQCHRASLSLSNVGNEIDIIFDLTDPTQFSMVKNNRFDLMTASIISSVLKEGDTFIDVGANWGYFTCIASRVVGLSGLIVAMEPNWRAHQMLLETVRRHKLPNVLAMNYAAYDSVGKAVSLFRPIYRQTTSSYVREGKAGQNSDTITTTLDYILSKAKAGLVRLVKIDTEGAELLVMKGARSLLKELKPLVILEVSAYSKRFGYEMDELYDYMRGLGYSRVYSIHDEPDQLALSDPLKKTVEGQILFQHKCSEPALRLCQVQTGQCGKREE